MQQSLRRTIWFCLNNSIVGATVGLCLLMGLLNDKFFSFANWINILNNLSVTGIVSLGVALVLIAGGIDLSFGSILASCAIIAAWLQPHGFLLPIVAALLLGALLGLINGLLVAKIDANPLITTLGTQWLYLSLLFIITDGRLVQGTTDNAFHLIGHGKLFGVPVPIFLLLGATVMSWFVASHTAFGKYVYAHGSNKTGLAYSGVNASTIYLLTFVFMGLLVGLAGIILSSRLVGVRPTEGHRYLIIVLTAVLLSGVRLTGGTGSLFHVLVAVVLLGVVDNSMVLLAVEYKYQQVIRGCIFLGAVVYNNLVDNYLASFRYLKE